ncbi:cytochrome-c peroxidase [Mangrovivirga cuniculi]|uniref:Methylamine utilization protein n=1 Tax=Mangrovivirga cuniculi TaxID=2715131 RepID=A0A4D7JT46_9BACT|nr:cytochrome c peroxidase [Mangrovivirga cuniculi]QCK16680.1 methylamine utilization protein [Mangrovivirga cuniculi]
MNIKIKLYAIIEACFIISLFAFIFSCGSQGKDGLNEKEKTSINFIYKADLSSCLSNLDSLIKSESLEEKQNFYLEARLDFKRLEPALGFVDIENYKYLNQPNILKVEEEDLTDIKIKKPSGFQVLEEALFVDNPDTTEVNSIARQTLNRLKLVENTTGLKGYKDYHILWMIRKEITRIALTGITGFDSPVLENSLFESSIAYQRIEDYLIHSEILNRDKQLQKKWSVSINDARSYLKGDFNEFNRYEFIKTVTHSQLGLWNETVEKLDVNFPFKLAFNNDMTSLFSTSTFNDDFFAERNGKNVKDGQILVGKALFDDTRLSSSGRMSCGTCHEAKKAFTDGKKVFAGQKRNTPTLTYAHLQQGFFFDNRSGSLEGQIVSVVNNEKEFHTDLSSMVETVKRIKEYTIAFDTLYDKGVDQHSVRHAIASYVRDLAAFDSRFDRAINTTERELLSEREINGFNLFMGKAKCATCHFAPVFNGTVPPDFTESEMELLGVPQTNDTINAKIDPDPGRYNLYNTPERRHFFKTPTVRNIAVTGPYMHNGVYSSLEEVMDFYNRGGGAGIGIAVQFQTLPDTPLNLSEKEMEDVILFMKSLTDAKYEPSKSLAVQ